MEHYILRLRNPEAAAQVLAQMLDGEVLPLPPLSNCWVIFCRDGVGLEIYPDVLNRRDADFDQPFANDKARATPVLGSVVDANRIATLAMKAGWPLRRLPSAAAEEVAIAVEGRQVLTLAGGMAPASDRAGIYDRGQAADRSSGID